MTPKKREVREWLRFYQELLGLENWDIKLKFCKKLHEGEALGICSTNEHWRRATIRILRLSDPEWEKDSHDVDEIVVHELLHVLWSFLEHYRKKNPHFIVHEEQSVKATAKALVTLKRQIESAP